MMRVGPASNASGGRSLRGAERCQASDCPAAPPPPSRRRGRRRRPLPLRLSPTPSSAAQTAADRATSGWGRTKEAISSYYEVKNRNPSRDNPILNRDAVTPIRRRTTRWAWFTVLGRGPAAAGHGQAGCCSRWPQYCWGAAPQKPAGRAGPRRARCGAGTDRAAV